MCDKTFMAQDVVHGAKKLRGTLRSGTTRFLLFGPVQKFSSVASWDTLFEAWIENSYPVDIKRICIFA